MSTRPQLLVLGAGPAGAAAAVAAADCGLEVVVVDQAPMAGGQIYRAMPETFAPTSSADLGPEHREGQELRRLLAESSARLASGRLVWSVGSDLRVDAIGPDGPESWQPQALVVAGGATERVVPFAGWTLPGVFGLAAATILLKSQLMLPGARTLVAGCGPLLFAVAHGIVKRGGRVVAVVDLAGRGDWLKSLPAMAARPRDLKRGAAWLSGLRAAGVPVLHRHGIREARETGDGLEVVIGPVDSDRRPKGGGERVLQADCLTVGHGLVPATEVDTAAGGGTSLRGRIRRLDPAAR